MVELLQKQGWPIWLTTTPAFDFDGLNRKRGVESKVQKYTLKSIVHYRKKYENESVSLLMIKQTDVQASINRPHLYVIASFNICSLAFF